MAINYINFNGGNNRIGGSGSASVSKVLVSRNVFDVSTMVGTTSQLINDANGAIQSTTIGSRVVEIPVEGGQTYCYRLASHLHMSANRPDVEGQRFFALHQYNGDTHIGIVDEIGCNEGGYMFTVADDATVIKFTVGANYISALDGLMLQRGGEVHDFEAYEEKYLGGVDTNLIGAQHPAEPPIDLPYNIAFLGDSIMTEAQGQWYGFLCEKFPIKHAYNLAVGQSRWKHSADTTYSLTIANNNNNVITNQINRLIYGVQQGTYPVPDIVVIHAGINDRGGVSATGYNRNWHLPTISSALNNGVVTSELVKPRIYDDDVFGDPATIFNFADSTIGASSYWIGLQDTQGTHYGDTILQTMVGAMRFGLELLRNAFPSVKIIMTTPLYTTADRTTYFKCRHLNQIIKDCCSYMSIPVIDLTYEVGIVPTQGNYNLIDGLHPNTGGAQLIADFVGHELVRRFGHHKCYDTKHYTITGHIYKSDGVTPVNAYAYEMSGGRETAIDGVRIFFKRTSNTEQYLYSGENGVIATKNGTAGVSLPAGWYILGQGYPSGGSSNLMYLHLTGDVELNIVTNIS